MFSSILQNIQKINCTDANFKISPAFNGVYFAASLKSAQDVGVWFLKDKPITLSAHHSSITALSFCDLSHGKLLCSCSDDNVILWDLSKYVGNEETFRGTVLYSGINNISSCCFDYWEYRVALCCDKTILILDITSREISKKLTHTASICGCEFVCKDVIISISNDGVCKVWNLCTGFSPCYKTIVGDPSVLITGYNMLAVVTTTGSIESFHLDSEYRLQRISLFKVWKLIRDAKRKQEINNELSKTDKAKDVETTDHEESTQILALKFLKFSVAGNDKKEFSSMAESCLYVPVYLFLVTSTGLLFVNTQSEVVDYYIFKEYFVSTAEGFLPAIVRSAVIFSTDEEITLILIPLTGCILYNCKIKIDQITSKLEHLNLEETAAVSKKQTLSFLSIADIPSGSLLLKELFTKERKKQGKYSLKVSKMAQPLTFQSKIHSSGYNTSPRSKMFCPVINIKKDNIPSIAKKKVNRFPVKTGIPETNYCNYWEKEPILAKTVKLSSQSNIMAQNVADGDMVVAFGLDDGLIEVAALPDLNIISSLLYHNRNTRSVHFSHSDSSKLLLSASSDKNILIWDWKGHCQKPLLVIDSICSKVKERLDKKKVPIPEEITAAQFYYLDKFILFSYGNLLNMSLYHIDLTKSDIQRYKTNSYHRNVLSVPLESKRINAVSAINQFYSHLVLCATSSGAIYILDMNTGQVAYHITEAHSRPVYQIILNQGSSHVNQPSEMHDIYGTAALTDGLKLWDLRSVRCVMYWKEHPNRCHPCNADISACGKYVICGGEDKAIYIYDIRTARIIHKLGGHSDVVSNVNFLPIMSKILATAHDGNGYIYGNGIS